MTTLAAPALARTPPSGARARHAADPAADPAGQVLRWAALGGVVLIAVVAAVVSYDHLRMVGQHAGEGWRAWTVPLSVDGLLLTASMTAAARHRAGRDAGALCWIALTLALAATLAGNVASAGDSITAKVYAGWPAIALLLAHELLMRELRRTARPAPSPTAQEPPADQPLAPTPDAADSAREGVITTPVTEPRPAPRQPLAPAARAASEAQRPTGTGTAGGTPTPTVPPPSGTHSGTQAARRHAVPGAGTASGTGAARLPDEAARQAARDLYQRKAAQGVPPSGTELGLRFGRSPRWGRAQAAAAQAAQAARAAPVPPPGTASGTGGTVAAMPRHRAAPGDAA